MTAAFVSGRIYGPHGLAGVNAYTPEASGHLYLEGWADWLGALLFHRHPLTLTTTALILIGLAIASWLSSDRTVRLGLVLALVGVLPVAFIRPMRGLEAICIPTAGLAWIAAWWITRLSLVFPHRARAPVLFVLLALILADLHARRMPPADALLAEGIEINSVMHQMRRMHPSLPPRARVLFAKDPFPEPFRWGTTFLLQIAYGPGVMVERSDYLPVPPDWTQYDYVFSWEGQRLVSLRDSSTPANSSVELSK